MERGGEGREEERRERGRGGRGGREVRGRGDKMSAPSISKLSVEVLL